MPKDWQKQEMERRRLIEEERTRFLAMDDCEAVSMSHADQYQRIRYQGEIMAANYIAELRRTAPIHVEPTKKTHKKQYWPVNEKEYWNK